ARRPTRASPWPCSPSATVWPCSTANRRSRRCPDGGLETPSMALVHGSARRRDSAPGGIARHRARTLLPRLEAREIQDEPYQGERRENVEVARATSDH